MQQYIRHVAKCYKRSFQYKPALFQHREKKRRRRNKGRLLFGRYQQKSGRYKTLLDIYCILPFWKFKSIQRFSFFLCCYESSIHYINRYGPGYTLLYIRYSIESWPLYMERRLGHFFLNNEMFFQHQILTFYTQIFQ